VRDLSGDALLAALSELGQGGEARIEQCRKIEDILRANQRTAYATYEMTVKLVLQSLITNL
jgi:hypothetical protein